MTARSRLDAGSRMEPDACPTRPELSDEQWCLICDLFADPAPDPRGGRPRANARRCVEGILWILRTGARWKDLPRSFPSYVTCWRRFEQWSNDGVWDRAWRRLIHKLDRRGGVAWDEGFADGTFAAAKKGAIISDQPSAARVRSSCSWSTAAACRSRSTSTAPVPAK
jgi:transposase